MSNIMRSVEVKNKEILNVLNEFIELWYNDQENFKKSVTKVGKTLTDQREYYISDQHKNEIMNMGKAHPGYPVGMVGYNMKRVVPGSEPHLQIPFTEDMLTNSENDFHFHKKYMELNAELTSILGSKVNALCCVYPPGGYIGWHNNANASSYNVIFTWSENGEGYWKHIDPYTNEEVIVPDVPGWQCKSFYFGSYKDDPKDLVYHMASTDCWRMTISYIFDREHEEFWKAAIDEIEYDD